MSMEIMFEPFTSPLVVTPTRKPLTFDQIPRVNLSYIDYPVYWQFRRMSAARQVLTLQATRGCPYQCLYCHKLWPKGHQFRRAEDLFDEVNHYYKMGIRKISFIDDIFNLDRKNTHLFYHLILKNKLKLELYFPNGMRGDILSHDDIDLMVEAGVVQIILALETASPRLQKTLRKNIQLDNLEDNLNWIATKHSHVILDIFAMFGFPTETEAEVIQTIDFIKRIKWIHFPGLFSLKIYPNTDMYDFAIENGVSKESIDQSLGISYSGLPETLPFPKSFAVQVYTNYIRDYFINPERLKHVLPHQSKLLTEMDMLFKYNSYFSTSFATLPELFRFLKVSEIMTKDLVFQPENLELADQFRAHLRNEYPPAHKSNNAFRVLLVDLSQLFILDKQHHYTNIEPPLGLMALLTYLEKHLGENISGKVLKSGIDFNTFEEMERIVNDFSPDLIGLRSLSFYRDFFHQTVGLLKQAAPNTPIISGGPYASSSYLSILEDKNIDLIVLGEGEETLLELIKLFKENANKVPPNNQLETIPGIAFRK